MVGIIFIVQKPQITSNVEQKLQERFILQVLSWVI